MAEVAVAVVSWNTRDLLARCLDSLRADAESGLAEVWVVDNASSDGSGDLVAEPYGSTQHSVHSFPLLGFTAAFNLGLHRVVPGLGDHLAIPGRWDPSRPREVDWAVGALLLVRRAAWENAGGFDPGQWMYAEDLD